MRKTTVNTTSARQMEIRKALAARAIEERSAAYHAATSPKVCFASVAGLIVHGKSTRN